MGISTIISVIAEILRCAQDRFWRVAPESNWRMNSGRFLIIASVALCCACGSKTNVLGLTAPKEHVESFESLLAMARAAYDRNDLKRALKYAKKAYKLDPNSEDASILFGFINLSLAGGDPFSLAEGLAANTGSTGGEGSTSGTLSSLKKVIGLKDEELAQMAVRDDSDPDLPVLIPGCAEDARQAVKKLAYLNDAINAVCRFIDPEARIDSDYRQNCASYTGPRRQANRGNFLWAFSHLTESLAFNSILTYATADPTGKHTNLELRAEKIKSLDTSADVTALVGAVDTLNKTLNAVLPSGGNCSETAPTSQLKATLNDMLAVDAAFSRIPGIPPKITASIKKTMEKIKGATDSTGATNHSSQTKALKADFSKKLSKSLGDKLDALAADPSNPLPADQKDALCASYGQIAEGSDQTSALCGGGG